MLECSYNRISVFCARLRHCSISLLAQTRTHETCSELEAVVLAPFFHYLHKVLHLGVVRVLQHLNHLNQALLILLSCDDHLEHSDCRATLALPKLGVWIQTLKYVKGLRRVVELTHLVAVVCDQV